MVPNCRTSGLNCHFLCPVVSINRVNRFLLTRKENFEMSLDITFDKPSGIYGPGESVTGHLIIVLAEPLTATDVRITIHGRAHTEWTESRSKSGENSLIDPYSGSENLFTDRMTVWGNPSVPSVLPAGRHTFAFSFPLQGGPLPGTFSHHGTGKGSIEYSVKAVISRSENNIDINKTERFFAVRPVSHLSRNPDSAAPQETHGGKNICCWTCFAGRVDVAVSLPKSGYVTEEVIAVKADIINHSRKIIKKVTMNLVQQVRMMAYGGKDRFDYRTLVESARNDPIKPGQTVKWVNEAIRVPPVAVAYPTLDCLTVMHLNVSYTVTTEVHINGSKKLKVDTPVIIGTSQ